MHPKKQKIPFILSTIQNAGFIRKVELRSISPGGKINTSRESYKGHFGPFPLSQWVLQKSFQTGYFELREV